MCDDHTEADNAARTASDVSRRTFAVIAGGAVAAVAAGQTATGETLGVTESDVTIATADGACDAYFVHPAHGRHPGVLIWPDIMGLRPAFRQMGKRLAQSGYAVLVVNPFYRTAKSPVLKPGESFTDAPTRERLMGLMRTLSPQTVATDAPAFMHWIDGQRAVDTRKKAATTGYCMGGPLVFRTAAIAHDRIGAAATFHGGGLVTAADTSPHKLIPEMNAQFLICVAQNDDEREPAAKDTLKDAFAARHLAAEIEVYPAQHGWCPPDSQVYDQAQAEKAWGRMLALFQTTLV